MVQTAHGEYKVPGGKLVVVDLGIAAGRLAAVQISGDFFLEPETALEAMDAALRGMDIGADEEALAAAVNGALPADAQLYGITPEGVAVAVRRALDAAALDAAALNSGALERTSPGPGTGAAR